MRSLAIGIILLVTFVIAFFIATAFFDTLEWHTGYYKQGVEDSQSISENFVQ